MPAVYDRTESSTRRAGQRGDACALRGAKKPLALPFAAALLLAAAACRTPTAASNAASASPTAPAPAARAPAAAEPALRVVATTSIVGDVVKAVGGDRAAVHVLIGPDTDPHDYKPTPGDLAAIETAAIVFENGLHLEVSLEPLLTDGTGTAKRVAVSEGIATMRGAAEIAEGDEHGEDDGGDRPGEGVGAGDPSDDPHVWWDPVRVRVWVGNIAAALSDADPAGGAAYEANAAAYAAELDALDAWIREQTASIAPERRVLVTDHDVIGYFATAYGFTAVGSVIPSLSTGAEPSARELAALEAAIQTHGVTVIFTGENVPATLSERVAADTGARLVPIYTEALSGPDGPAATYLAFMRHNVATIVAALRR